MANTTNENRNAAFIENLYEEKLRHKDHRHTFVVQKLLFIIGLFGLGALDVKGDGKLGELFNTGFLLYLVPFVALAYDLYIHAEDFKVKRIGFFVRTRKVEEVYKIEMDWEKWVSSHREGLAEQASKALTWIASITAFLLILLLDATNPFGKMDSTGFIILDAIRDLICYNFFILWCGFSMYFIFRAGFLSGESNQTLKHALRALSPLILNIEEANITADKDGKLSPELKQEFKNQLLRIPDWVEIVKEGTNETRIKWVGPPLLLYFDESASDVKKGEVLLIGPPQWLRVSPEAKKNEKISAERTWAIYERRRHPLLLYKRKTKLYTIKKEKEKLLIEQLY